MKNAIYHFILSSCLITTVTLASNAQNGSLDLTFGSGGIVTTAVGNYDEAGRSVAIQNDGKIVVAGYSNNGSTNDFALIRYNNDGSLDSSFNTTGIVTTNFGLAINSAGNSITIQSDGKILVAGNSEDNIGWYDFTLVRYNTDGTLDNSFDIDGKVTTAIGVYNDIAYSVAIQGDGKIVVAGNNIIIGYLGDIALLRYNTDGSLDTTFASDGTLITDIDDSDDEGFSVAIQNDGKIVVVGSSYRGSPDDGFAVVRYNIDGTLDTTFSSDGKVTTGVGTYGGRANSVAIQDEGKIVVAGYSYDDFSHTDFQAVRYNSDGSLDNTFGSGGKVTTVLNKDDDDGASSVVIQDDGRIVAAGYTAGDFGFDFALVRYNSDGSLDNTFSSDGKAITDFGSFDDYGNSVAIQHDGKIVVAGEYNFSHFAVARYNDGTVSITENLAEENSITVSPNPFNNELLIKGTKGNEEIRILNEMGTEMMRQKTFDTETKINSDKLLPGIYFLQCTDGNKMASTKLVKF